MAAAYFHDFCAISFHKVFPDIVDILDCHITQAEIGCWLLKPQYEPWEHAHIYLVTELGFVKYRNGDCLPRVPVLPIKSQCQSTVFRTNYRHIP
ncbi:hypothetical protein D3C84_905770 [compost metagenome]